MPTDELLRGRFSQKRGNPARLAEESRTSRGPRATPAERACHASPAAGADCEKRRTPCWNRALSHGDDRLGGSAAAVARGDAMASRPQRPLERPVRVETSDHGSIDDPVDCGRTGRDHA